MATTRNREVFVNQLIYDQVDYFEPDEFTRVTGLGVSDVALQIFFNNTVVNWPLTDGSTTADAQIVSGQVFFTEVTGSPGIYNVRWRPNISGYWRLILSYTVGQQITALGFDVRAESTQISGGLRASFTNPSC